MNEEPIKHLLIPKEFRVFCRPNHPISTEMQFCRLPCESICGNCLTAFRTKTTGNRKRFGVRHTTRESFREKKEREDAINQ